MNNIIEVFNLLLYIKYGKEIKKIDKNKIFEFNNDRIIAVDEGEYSREERSNLKKESKIKTYYITDGIFDTILKQVCSGKTDFILRDIVFDEYSVNDTIEYSDIKYLINKKEYEKAYKEIYSVLDEYYTSIKMVKLFFQGYDFCLFIEGRIEAYAPEEVVKELVKNEKFNSMILGE